MKKFMTFGIAAMMSLSLIGCGNTVAENTVNTPESQQESTAAEENGENTITAESSTEESSSEQAPEKITIKTLNGAKEEIDLEVPYNPERIAILDMAALDILDNLGLGEKVVGSASTSLEYLQSYVTKDTIENLGTIKEADLEAVMASEPDVIFIGGRLSASYDALSEIAPVIYLATDAELGVVESVRKNAVTIASIFGLEEKINEKMADFDARIAALGALAEGKEAVVGMCTSGSFNILGDDGRCSIIGREIGFKNLGNNAEEAESTGDTTTQGGTATHGNEASFELLVEWNPAYIFVMDRDAAINTDGAKLAQEIMENELVMNTDAYKNGNIIYLQNPAVWYTAEGGITALDIMLQDLEGELLQ